MPTSEFLGSLVDVGMRGTGVGCGIQRWCEKTEPKGEWLLGVNRESSLCVVIVYPFEDVSVCMHAAPWP